MPLCHRIASLFVALALTPAAVKAEPARSVSDIPPVASLVSMVAGEDATVTILMPPGTSAHGFSLKPSTARALSDADLVVWIGAGLTPGLGDQMEALAGQARHLALSEVPGTHRLAFREGGFIEDDHGHDHGADDHDNHDHGDEGHHDPHLWLDPENATLWLGAIAETLAELDPGNADLYRDNARAGAAEIAAAVADARGLLTPIKGVEFAASHDAFQYFEHAFGLSMIGALSDGDDAAPGAARLESLRDHFAEHPPVCVFAEPGADPDLISAIAGDVPVAELDVMGAAHQPGRLLYPEMIRDLARNIAACGSGS